MDKNFPPTDSRITFIQKFGNNHYNFPRKGREAYKSTRGVPCNNTRGVYRVKALEVYLVTTLEVYRVIALEVYIINTRGIKCLLEVTKQTELM